MLGWIYPSLADGITYWNLNLGVTMLFNDPTKQAISLTIMTLGT